MKFRGEYKFDPDYGTSRASCSESFVPTEIARIGTYLSVPNVCLSRSTEYVESSMSKVFPADFFTYKTQWHMQYVQKFDRRD